MMNKPNKWWFRARAYMRYNLQREPTDAEIMNKYLELLFELASRQPPEVTMN